MSVLDKYQSFIYIFAVALFTWWLQQVNEQRDTEINVTGNSPDFYSSGYYKKETGLDGLPKSELTAEKMQHYKQDGSTHLERPVMNLYNPNAAPWVIHSESGIMAADGDNLQLNGKAVINRDAYKRSSALKINTSNLRVKLSTSYAETADWAELISPPNQTAGTGMEVTFASPIHLKLLSKVKGRYEIK